METKSLHGLLKEAGFKEDQIPPVISAVSDWLRMKSAMLAAAARQPDVTGNSRVALDYSSHVLTNMAASIGDSRARTMT